MSKKRLTAYLLLTITAAIWGVAAPVIKVTVAVIPPFAFLFWRFLLTSLIFLPLFLWRVKKEKETLTSLLPLIPLGFLGVPATLVFVFLGFERTSAMDGVVIAALAPIFIVAAGILFLKEEVNRLETVGLALAVAGTIVIVTQPLLGNGLFASQNLKGNLLILISDFIWTAYVILSKEEFKRHSPFVITAVSFFVGLVTILPLTLFEQQENIFNFQSLIIESGALWGLLYIILLSSVVAYFTFQWGLSLIEASEATLFAYLQPIFAAPAAIFWLGEKISFPFLLGAAIITLGVILTEYRPRKNIDKNTPLS